MGVLPLQFKDGDSAQSLGLTGREVFDIAGLERGAAKSVTVIATAEDGTSREFEVRLRIDTPKELEYYRTAASCSTCCGSSPSARRAA